MDVAEATDSELVLAIQRDGAGCVAEELMRRHLPRVRGMMYQMALNHADADDLTQEVFIRAWRGLAKFHGGASFSTWLHRIAMNCAMSFLGRQIGMVDPRTGTNRTGYLANGRVDYVEDAVGYRTTFGYDAATGRRIAVTDALTNTVYTAYDVQGRVTNTWGSTYPVAYEYDAYGRMTALKTWRDTNGAPDATHWNYDEATGLLTNKVYADGVGPSYAYDAAGRLTKRTWARGVETDYAYDALGQLTNIAYSDSTPDVAFTYDRLGRQLTATDALGTRTNHYDALTLLEERLPNGTVLARSVDSFGRPSGIALDADYAIGYGYDEFGRFAAVAVSNGVQFDYSYVPDSDLLSGWSVSNGASAAYAYEPNRNLRTEVVNTFDGSPVSAFAYAYDAAGRRTQRVDSGLTTNLFGYNMKSELADAIMGTNIYAYLYDPIGNRQLASVNEVTNLYQANELNQYTNINEGAVEPVYDADGNMTSYGSWQFTWDAENRLVKVAPHYLITGSRIYEYEYDYMSRRVKKTAKRYTMPMSTWTMRTFDYDGWNLIRERVEFDGAVSTNQYVWGLDLSQSLQGAGGVGGLLAILSPDSRLLTPAYDANGNITDLVDTNGAVVAHYEYDPYGNTIAQSGDYADLNPLRFSSKYWDGETEFYYYGFRYFTPSVGRWLNRDPIGERGGSNLYGFLRNAVVNGIDFMGFVELEIKTWGKNNVYAIIKYDVQKDSCEDGGGVSVEKVEFVKNPDEMIFDVNDFFEIIGVPIPFFDFDILNRSFSLSFELLDYGDPKKCKEGKSKKVRNVKFTVTTRLTFLAINGHGPLTISGDLSEKTQIEGECCCEDK